MRDSDQFNRKTINILWCSLLICFILQLALYPLASESYADFSTRHYFLNTIVPLYLLLLAINFTIEFFIRRVKRRADLATVVGAHAFAFVLALFIGDYIDIPWVFTVFPQLLSILYLYKPYQTGSFVFGTSYSIILFLIYGDFEFVALGSLLATLGIQITCLLTGYGILNRGMKLLESLERSMKSEQEYMIKNIVMDRMSKMDPLTELCNHKTFHEYFDRLIDHHRHNAFALQLAVLDIDNFKKVNDTYGHAVGDVALKTIADRIKAHLGADDFAARYGGGGFVVLLSACSDEDAFGKIEHLRECIASTPIEEMGGQCITVSVGLHSYKSGETKYAAFQRADQALYEAKRTGKNKTVVR